jgi:hypothetical protein
MHGLHAYSDLCGSSCAVGPSVGNVMGRQRFCTEGIGSVNIPGASYSIVANRAALLASAGDFGAFPGGMNHSQHDL